MLGGKVMSIRKEVFCSDGFKKASEVGVHDLPCQTASRSNRITQLP